MLTGLLIVMKIGIMQPYFFPYIGYWQLVDAVDIFVVYDDVNYIKNGWINRNKILVNGSEHYVTLPLQNMSPFKKINEIYVTDNIFAKNKLLKTIKQNYRKAKYFEQIMPMIESTVCKQGNNLSNIVVNSINEVCSYLGITTKIVLSSFLDKKKETTAQETIISLVKSLGGDFYYNAIGGKSLYDKEAFLKKGISLSFIKTMQIYYKQFNNFFVPNLSIMDVLMFNSPLEISNMLKCYELE